MNSNVFCLTEGGSEVVEGLGNAKVINLAPLLSIYEKMIVFILSTEKIVSRSDTFCTAKH